NTIVHYFFTNIEVLHITLDATFKVKSRSIIRAFVDNRHINTFGQVGLVTKIVNNPLIIKFYRFFKDSWIWVEGDRRTSRPITTPNLFKWYFDATTLEFNSVELSFLHHFGNHMSRKCVYYARPHSMETR